MWQVVTREVNGHHYVCDFLREYHTDTRHLKGTWISILKIKKDDQLIYHYKKRVILDEMDDTDRTVFQEILDIYS